MKTTRRKAMGKYQLKEESPGQNRGRQTYSPFVCIIIFQIYQLTDFLRVTTEVSESLL
jgi:hypothetical protein